MSRRARILRLVVLTAITAALGVALRARQDVSLYLRFTARPALSIGMSEEEVRAAWGAPDGVTNVNPNPGDRVIWGYVETVQALGGEKAFLKSLVHFDGGRVSSFGAGRTAYAPWWITFAWLAASTIVGLLALRDLVLLIRDLRRQRPLHECARCGYDLTGNVSGRCPECGADTPTTTLESPAAGAG